MMQQFCLEYYHCYHSSLRLGGVLEKALRIAGLIRLDSIAAIDCVRWVLPETLLLGTSLSLYIVCGRQRKRDPEDIHIDITRTDSTTESQDPALKSKFNFLNAIGNWQAICVYCRPFAL